MGDDAVILEDVESDKARTALYSTVHGDGRVFGRKEAKHRLSRYNMKWMRGSATAV
jgi:tRNA-splicing ligase RtcB (3'-phosphate/5'-hydroxy nucleic acid ligase)